jgi:hypothetical protein
MAAVKSMTRCAQLLVHGQPDVTTLTLPEWQIEGAPAATHVDVCTSQTYHGRPGILEPGIARRTLSGCRC